MAKLLWIAFGGAAGSALRYWVSGWAQRWTDSSFPVGTLTVNVVGCFAIAFLNVVLLGPLLVREEARLALLVGVLGGFTTFSTFGWETLALLNEGQLASALANIALNNLLGLGAAWLAYRLAETWIGV